MAEENEEMSADELRQMQKLQEFRKLATAILLRRIILIGIVGTVTVAGLAAFFLWKGSKSNNRFESLTTIAFYPKSTTGIKPLDVDQVMRIITRRSLVGKTAVELGIPENEVSAQLGGCFDISQDRNSKNFYTIKACAPDYNGAINRVNAYADVAIREYVATRLEDLRVSRESIDRRKAEIAVELGRIDTEENALATELRVVSPFNESERLGFEIGNKKLKLSEALLALTESQTRLADVKKRLGDANPDILGEADLVKKFTEKLLKCDEEIEKLALVYTDENPKLVLARDERRSVAARYDKLLAKYGMKQVDEGDLARIDALGKQAKSATQDIDRYTTITNALQHEIDVNQVKLDRLMKVLHRFEGFKTRRESIKAALTGVNESDADIRFLEATVKSELSQVERASVSMGASRLGKKKLIVVVAGGGIIAGMLAFFIFFLEILRGRVHDAKEISFYVDAVALGEEGAGKDSDEEAFLRFRAGLGEGKKLFIAPLGGCDAEKNGFYERFLLQCSLAGLKTLLVEVVKAKDYVPNEDDAMFTAICYRGDRGAMPVVDPHALSAMELSMLEADLAMLTSDFDLVALRGPAGSATGVLAEQLTSICDARLALVKPRKTLRSQFRAFIESKGPKAMALAVKSLLLTAALSWLGCYPDRFTGNFEQYPDLVDETSAIVDEMGLGEEELEQRRRFLQALEDEPPEVYRINAGDRVHFTVYDHPDLTMDATVTPDGHLGIVFLGQVKVADLTLTEACRLIEKGLSRYLKKPAVGITPLEISSQSCTIAGGVMRAGVYPISSSMRLADLYSIAGGSAVRKLDGQDLDIADMINSYIFRDGKALPVDFQKAIYEGDHLHNLRLRKNDYIYIGVRTESMVCVLGDIRMPRKQLYARELGLIELLTNAGWFMETHWKYVIIIRGGVFNPKIYKVDVDAILAGKRPNVLLMPADIVYVPHDNISEYNVFVRKLLPTGQLFNLFAQPFSTWSQLSNQNSNNGAAGAGMR